jgi:hypothetical protein
LNLGPKGSGGRERGNTWVSSQSGAWEQEKWDESGTAKNANSVKEIKKTHRALKRYECRLTGWLYSSCATDAPMPGNASAFLREASLTCKLRRHAKVHINAPSLTAHNVCALRIMCSSARSA